MSYVVWGDGSGSLSAEGYGYVGGGYDFSDAHRKVEVSISVSGSTLYYTIYSYTNTPSDNPKTQIRFYVNETLVHDSGYDGIGTSVYPRKNGSYYSGSCTVPSTGHPTVEVQVGISKNGSTQASASGTIYRATTTYYRVTFVDGLGSTLKTQDVASGGYATPPSNPSRTGYTFAGWSGSYTNVTSDRTITATWRINSYTVSFVDGFGSTLKSQTVNYGGHATPPSDPERNGYTFLNWSGEYTSVTSNRTITAVWREHLLTVNYYSNYATEAFSGALNEVGADRNVLVRQTTHSYSAPQPDGLWDYSKPSSSTYLERTHYKGTGNWGTETEGGYLVDESAIFISGQALAEALGVSLVEDSITVNVYPQWEIQANCFQKQEGKFLLGMIYKRVNGKYKTGLVKLRKNGSYTDTSM